MFIIIMMIAIIMFIMIIIVIQINNIYRFQAWLYFSPGIFSSTIYIYTYIYIYIYIYILHGFIFRLGLFPQMLESIGKVYESQIACCKFEEIQRTSTVLKNTPGENKTVFPPPAKIPVFPPCPTTLRQRRPPRLHF